MTFGNNVVMSAKQLGSQINRYSMTGSRNGSDGSADCSGFVTQSLKDATNINYSYLYSTVTIQEYLFKLGYKLVISANHATNSWSNQYKPKAGDVFIWSGGSTLGASSGAGGHTGIFTGNGFEIIHCNFSSNGVAITQYDPYLNTNWYEWVYSAPGGDDNNNINEEEEEMTEALLVYGSGIWYMVGTNIKLVNQGAELIKKAYAAKYGKGINAFSLTQAEAKGLGIIS